MCIVAFPECSVVRATFHFATCKALQNDTKMQNQNLEHLWAKHGIMHSYDMSLKTSHAQETPTNLES